MRTETTPKSKIFARIVAPGCSRSGNRTISGGTGYWMNSELASRRSCSGARATPSPRTVRSRARSIMSATSYTNIARNAPLAIAGRSLTDPAAAAGEVIPLVPISARNAPAAGSTPLVRSARDRPLVPEIGEDTVAAGGEVQAKAFGGAVGVAVRDGVGQAAVLLPHVGRVGSHAQVRVHDAHDLRPLAAQRRDQMRIVRCRREVGVEVPVEVEQRGERAAFHRRRRFLAAARRRFAHIGIPL